ncbi:unnamed protein product, partial [Sphacelaria rigidula]
PTRRSRQLSYLIWDTIVHACCCCCECGRSGDGESSSVKTSTKGRAQETDIESPGQLKPGQVLPLHQIPSPRPLSTAPAYERNSGPLASSQSAGRFVMTYST